MPDKNTYAVIGGGLAGLTTAYQLSELQPGAHITLFEKGTGASYNAGNDTEGRASLSSSPARTIRLSGTEGPAQWAVRETKAMLDLLQAEMQADPASYPGLEGKKLFYPQPAVTVAPDTADPTYQKHLASLQPSGAAYEETDGATLKARFPNLYKTLADSAAVLIESSPGPTNMAGVAGLIDVESTLKALTFNLRKKGVSLRSGETVTAVTQAEGSATVTTSGGTSSFSKAIIAPGQWIESLVNTKDHGIELRYDRAIILDINLKAMGLETTGIPFTKGLKPEGGTGSMYSYMPDAAEGRLKFIPAASMTSVTDAALLKLPVTEAEKDAALSAAAILFQAGKEKVSQHATASVCAFTSPRVKENPLITKLSEDITLTGLDSSSTARTSAGLGKITASLALGREEPFPGAYEKYSLDAHKALVAQSPQIAPGSAIERMLSDIRQTLGL